MVGTNTANSFDKTSQLAFMHFAKAAVALFDDVMPEKDVIRANLAWCFSGRFLADHDKVDQLISHEINSPNKQSKTGYEIQLAALDAFDAFDATTWFHTIDLPCLFIASDQDAVVFASQVKAMANKVKDSEYYLFENGVGHLPHIERPELFAKKLIEFLQKK